MKVKIKSFDVDMEVKSKGIEFDVYKPNGVDRLGDVILTMSGLTWCDGKTSRKKGKKVKWEKFIAWMETQP